MNRRMIPLDSNVEQRRGWQQLEQRQHVCGTRDLQTVDGDEHVAGVNAVAKHLGAVIVDANDPKAPKTSSRIEYWRQWNQLQQAPGTILHHRVDNVARDPE